MCVTVRAGLRSISLNMRCPIIVHCMCDSVTTITNHHADQRGVWAVVGSVSHLTYLPTCRRRKKAYIPTNLTYLPTYLSNLPNLTTLHTCDTTETSMSHETRASLSSRASSCKVIVG